MKFSRTQPLRRTNPRQVNGLRVLAASTTLLVLAVLLLGEVLIFLPSIANFRMDFR